MPNPQVLQTLLLAAALGFAACAATAASAADALVVLWAAGDIGYCDSSGPAPDAAARTARLMAGDAHPVLALGDLAYPRGRQRDFDGCFAPAWGQLRPRLLPVPGNHDYDTRDAAPYFRYVEGLAQDAGRGYYALRLGAWRVIALNSNIDTGPDSEQLRWLRTELAEHRTRCTLAFWHHPRFSSGEHGDDARMHAAWRLLHDSGVDLVLGGHDHDYERFAPLDADGRPDLRGMRQFVVGTGGAPLRRFGAIRPGSEARNDEAHGALRVTLRAGDYDWAFVPIDGQTYVDSGSGRCRD
jgi:hypothetical protein